MTRYSSGFLFLMAWAETEGRGGLVGVRRGGGMGEWMGTYVGTGGGRANIEFNLRHMVK